jgi:DNA-binding winged helix-turn-helix (wHTH) protein/Flp pilus assembly protein TadD
LATFGRFTLDPDSGRLRRDGIDVPLRKQAFLALQALATHPGQFLDYERLITEAWGGTSVSRHTVDVTLAEVRKTLGDHGSWIRRRPKRGYGLVIPTSETLVRTGLHFFHQRSREGLERALDCFEQAAVEAPHDHRAFEGQAGCYLMLGSLGLRPGRDIYPRFQAALRQAVELVGMTPELRCDYAHGLHMYERRLDEAEAEFRQVIAERPMLAIAYVRMTMLYATAGDVDAALESVGRARIVDPLLPLTAAAEVAVRLWRREFDIAVSLGAQAIQLHPYLLLARAFYGIALHCSGRLEEALEQYRVGILISQGLSWLRGLEAVCLVDLRREREARNILRELLACRRTEYVDAHGLSRVYLALGDFDAALAELERAIEENVGGLHALTVDPLSERFRADRRFKRLVKKYRTPPGPGG